MSVHQKTFLTADDLDPALVITQADLDTALAGLVRTNSTVAGTTYTFVFGDAHHFMVCTGASPVLTIPPQTEVAWAADSVLSGVQYGTGNLSIEGAVGVTVHGTPGLTVESQYGVWEARRIAEDEWLVYGRLEA